MRSFTSSWSEVQFLLEQYPFPLTKEVESFWFSTSFLQKVGQGPYGKARLYKACLLKERFACSEVELLQMMEEHYFEGQYFSSSYSGAWLFFALAERKLGVDVEVIKSRSSLLLDAVGAELRRLFWKADWRSFYLLWTAKEAILKRWDAKSLDLMEQISFSAVEKKPLQLWGMHFDRELKYGFEGQAGMVRSGENWLLAWSFAD